MSRRNQCQIMELRPLKLGLAVGYQCKLGKHTSLTLKCHNLSLDDSIGVIPTSEENRFIEKQCA